MDSKGRHLAPLSYPEMFELAFECKGQHSRPYEVIDEVQKLVQILFLTGKSFYKNEGNKNRSIIRLFYIL